jgi:hypothetical protein
MRGAERPAGVRWTRPFLGPLKPLALEAARQTFVDITDNAHDTKDMDEVLALTGNMPLAIDLVAHLVDSEGVSGVLARWETQRTSILSEGYDSRSNLELSISLSLSGPRMSSSTHAGDLLSLLSMLPDGLSDVELLQSNFPLDNILACKSVLLRTALAYNDDQKRLKTLVPIREYMQKHHPPGRNLIQPLFQHFQGLLDLHTTYTGTLSSSGILDRITANFANLQNVLLAGLHNDNPDLSEIIHSACDFDLYGEITGQGQSVLLDHIPQVLPQLRDHKLEVYFITRVLSAKNRNFTNAEQLIDQALQDFAHFDDSDMQCKLFS